jgi:hypothetical protein
MSTPPATPQPESRWIRFLQHQTPRSRKTPVFGVVKKLEGKDGQGDEGMLHELGEVRWWGAWRCFAFFPADGTLFESTCLWDLAAFCAWLTGEHRRACAARKASR